MKNVKQKPAAVKQTNRTWRAVIIVYKGYYEKDIYMRDDENEWNVCCSLPEECPTSYQRLRIVDKMLLVIGGERLLLP